MNTTADENKAQAIEHLREAIKNLSTIIVDECHGCDEYTVEYRETLRDTMYVLVRNRDKLLLK